MCSHLHQWLALLLFIMATGVQRSQSKVGVFECKWKREVSHFVAFEPKNSFHNRKIQEKDLNFSYHFTLDSFVQVHSNKIFKCVCECLNELRPSRTKKILLISIPHHFCRVFAFQSWLRFSLFEFFVFLCYFVILLRVSFFLILFVYTLTIECQHSNTRNSFHFFHSLFLSIPSRLPIIFNCLNANTGAK